MNELFGIPLGTLLVVLGAGVAIALGAVGALALRNPILFRLGVRNAGRRRARSALIVLGLMLGTTIVSAALVTGDTMSHTIRSTATQMLGETDEVVSAKGAAEDIPGELGQATGTGYFDERTVDRVEGALSGTNLVDGVTGAIQEPVAVQAVAQRQTEPTVSLFATDPTRMEGFARIHRVEGGTVSLDDLGRGEIYLNEEAGRAPRLRRRP